jgi:hypothetical protein
MEAGRATNVESPFLQERHGDHQAGRGGDGPAHDFDSGLEKRRGRSFGAALSEVHRANTLTPSTGLAAGHTIVMPPHRGLPGSGRWRQLFDARVMPVSGL